MKNAALELVKYSLAKNHTISVWDGEEWQVKRSTDYDAIFAAIDSVEAAQLRIRSSDGELMAWALVCLFDLSPDETIINYTNNDYMNEFDAYMAKEQTE